MKASDQFNAMVAQFRCVDLDKPKAPIRSISIDIMYWEPDRLFPDGGWVADVHVTRQDGSTEVHSTKRMYRSREGAEAEAKQIKLRMKGVT